MKKAKEQVRLRSRKLKGGASSLYLDIYSKGMRRYEYLHLYLREERTPNDRNLNAETLRVAEALRARAMIEFQRREGGLPVGSSMTVASLLDQWLDTRKGRSAGTLEVWRGWVNRVKEFPLAQALVKDAGKEWWRRYGKWVRVQKLNATTQYHYLSRMRSVLKWAVAEGMMKESPCEGERLSVPPRSERVWLTVEEVRKLKEKGCGNALWERSFLFGCVTGLRYSDIRDLKWSDVQDRRIVKRIVKTGKVEYVDLNAQALELMGRPASGAVFPRLPQKASYVDQYLRRWAREAGLKKRVTFHTSRHTFAVLMLSAGVDIYTLSRLLGHSSVTTTQIYADIADARRREAVEKLPIL